MGRPKKSRNDPSPPPVEDSDCEMEDPGLEEAADGDSPECAENKGPRERPDFIDLTGEHDHSAAPCTPFKSSQSADPSTPDSGYGDGEELSLDGTAQLVSPKTLVGVISNMCDEIRKPFSGKDRNGPGYAYVFYDPSDDGDMYKIGQSKDVPDRENAYELKCEITTWELESRPHISAIWGHDRLEKLAHKQLGNSNFTFLCRCRTNHREFFMGKKEPALDALDIWTKWLWQSPYDINGQLAPFWERRLELLEPNFLSAFSCGKADCPSKDESAPACSACLMEGWKVWTTPTLAEKVVFSVYTSIPWSIFCWRVFLFLFLYMSALGAGNMYLLCCFLEGTIAAAFYPYPQPWVKLASGQWGRGPQPGDAGVAKHNKGSPKGKQPTARIPPSSLRRTSRSLLRLRSSPPMDDSPCSPSEKAVVRKARKPKKHSRESSPSPSPTVLPQSSSEIETDALRSRVDESVRKQPRRSLRLAELAETRATTSSTM